MRQSRGRGGALRELGDLRVEGTVPQPLPLLRVQKNLAAALSLATADQVELLWTETTGGSARSHAAAPSPAHHLRQLLVQVVDCGRAGWYRCSAFEPGPIADAIRQAVAASRNWNGTGELPRFANADEPEATLDLSSLHDPEIAGLDAGAARRRLSGWIQGSEEASLDWSETRIAVANSCGLRRAARVTDAALTVLSGQGEGSAVARDSRRRLADLDAEAVVARARRQSTDSGSSPIRTPLDLRGVAAARQALLLSPEAAGDLVWLLGRVGLSAEAFSRDGKPTSLARQLGHSVVSSRVHLVDDALTPAGLAFPFDLSGRAKRPTELVVGGVLRTPTVPETLAKSLGLAPTPHHLAPGEARPGHLRLMPGDRSLGEILAEAGEGVWIDRLDALEGYDQGRLRFRAQARGLRRIAGGALAEPLPDTVWEDSLDRVFRDVALVGHECSVQPRHQGVPGFVSAPAILVAPPR